MQIYSNWHSVAGIFQRISPQMQNSDIEMCILMAASEDNFILEILLNDYFLRTATKTYLFLTVTCC